MSTEPPTPKPRYRPSRLSGLDGLLLGVRLEELDELADRSRRCSCSSRSVRACGLGSAAATCPPRGATSYHHPRRNDRSSSCSASKVRQVGGLALQASRASRQRLLVSGTEGRDRRRLVAREHRIGRQLDRGGRPPARRARPSARARDGAQPRSSAVHRVERRASASGSGQSSTSARGYGSSSSHCTTRMRRDADGAERAATVGELGRLDDPRDGADAEAHVAAADLAPALDEHDAEPPVAGEAVARERPVPRLEDVQRQRPATGTARCRAGTSAAQGSSPGRRQRAEVREPGHIGIRDAAVVQQRHPDRRTPLCDWSPLSSSANVSSVPSVACAKPASAVTPFNVPVFARTFPATACSRTGARACPSRLRPRGSP